MIAARKNSLLIGTTLVLLLAKSQSQILSTEDPNDQGEELNIDQASINPPKDMDMMEFTAEDGENTTPDSEFVSQSQRVGTESTHPIPTESDDVTTERESEIEDWGLPDNQNTSSSCPVNAASFLIEGPMSIMHLDFKKPVKFRVGLEWAPNISGLLVVEANDKEVYRRAIEFTNASCGEFLSEDLELMNSDVDKSERPDGIHPRLLAYLSIGDSAYMKRCLNRVCKIFPLEYDFLPLRDNIKLLREPPDLRAGQRGVVRCEINDGHPLAEPFAIRVINHVTGEPIKIVNDRILEMESALIGDYQCLVRSYAFGTDTTIISDTVFSIGNDSFGEPAGQGKANGETSSPASFDINAPRRQVIKWPLPHAGVLEDPALLKPSVPGGDTMDVQKIVQQKEAQVGAGSRTELVVGLLVSSVVVLLLEKYF